MFSLSRVVAASLLLMLAACGGGDMSEADPPGPQQLPNLRNLDAKSGAGLPEDLFQEGAEAFQRFNCSENTFGTISIFDGGWAIYRFAVGTDAELKKLRIDFKPGGMVGAWVALSDYADNRWILDSPYDGYWFAEYDLNSGQHISPAGNIYVAVIPEPQHWVQVTSLELTLLGLQNEPPTASLTAKPMTGQPSDPLTLDATSSSDPDGSLSRFEWDLDGDGEFEYESTPDPVVQSTFPDPAAEIMVSVRVTDNGGATALASAQVSSMPCAPVGPLQLYEGIDANALPIGFMLIAGHPAIAWTIQAEDSAIYFQRALAPDGSSWDEPVVVDSQGGVYGGQMALIDGRPALAYSQPLEGYWYVRALDELGDAWSDPVLAFPTALPGDVYLAEVDGNPALLRQQLTSKLHYCRANDPDGQSWGDDLAVTDALDTFFNRNLVLGVVNANPAISYLVEAESPSVPAFVAYLRADDSLGTVWPAPQVAFELPDAGSMSAGFHSRATVEGHPAIATWNGYDELVFSRSLDESGAAWAQPNSMATGGASSDWVSLAVIGGKPAITWRDRNEDNLLFAPALDSYGDSWDLPTAIDTAPESTTSILMDFYECPAVVYRSTRYEGDVEVDSLRYFKGHAF